jgi:serine/threonine protein kinase
MKIGLGIGTGTGPANDLSGSGPATAFVPPSPEQLQRLLPQFEVLGMIGRGGMGAVYRARQKSLDRLVALKILAKRADQDPKFNERFAREARTLARLSHPNIISVFDFGEVEGLCYLVMEYLDGVNLRQMLQTEKMAPKEALVIVPDLCAALQYAHDQGIVHRDIKPENILIDRQGRVKIADFGLAKLLGTEAGRAGSPLPAAGQPTPGGAHGVTRPTNALTDAGKIMGTPHYMAPEQIEHPQAVDHRADIYSLGVVFYEMLTGELPVGKFAPPSRKVQIDVRLDEVVLRTLEKEPERRYQQASQVQTALETIASQPALVSASASRKPVVLDEPLNTPEVQAVKAKLQFVSLILVVLGLGGVFGIHIKILGIHFANWLGNYLHLPYLWSWIAGWIPRLHGFPGLEIEGFIRMLVVMAGILALISVWNLRQCRGYTLALIAIALSWLQPLLWPLMLPLGICAWTVLRRRDIRAAFLARKNRLQRDGACRVDVRDAYRLAVASAVLGLISFLFLLFDYEGIFEALGRMKIIGFIIGFMRWNPPWAIMAIVFGWVALVIMRDLAGRAKGMDWATFGVLYPSLFPLIHRLSPKPQEDSARLEQLFLTELAVALVTALIASWGTRRWARWIRTGSETAIRQFMNRWVGMTGVVFLASVGFNLFSLSFLNIPPSWYSPISRGAMDFFDQHKNHASPTAAEDKGFSVQTGFGTVELRAIAEPADASTTCWLPDGTPLCQQTSPQPRNTDHRKNTRELLFYIEVSPPRNADPREVFREDSLRTIGGISQVLLSQLRIECFANLSGTMKACRQGLLMGNAQAVEANMPIESQIGFVRLGLPTKVWEETDASWTWTGDWRRLKKKSIRRKGQEWEIWFQNIQDSPAAMSITFTHNTKRDWEARLVAVDQEGLVHEPESPIGGGGQSYQQDAEIMSYLQGPTTFRGMNQSRLKELRFQVRPYYWVEFRNISLRPGQLTQVEVKDLDTTASGLN